MQKMETLWQSDNLGRQGSGKKRFQYPTFKTLDLEAMFFQKGKSRLPGAEGKNGSISSKTLDFGAKMGKHTI
jgi:hypothetical protein